ncbi:hypothetical protein OGAPHI_006246 [Ogataea philodendri]|uniref:Uncharacterized protein n=1 Tax=Ogataea philodendri TaxID=1378263 RepID=A0A9P8NYX6_9ASCO|nr:uncharacterized protein OGAPHI_006246 [Ogataea philodendri]KAH3662065.1 hypothetical protein OGAPHI_006246 [Ogataea philodendri]
MKFYMLLYSKSNTSLPLNEPDHSLDEVSTVRNGSRDELVLGKWQTGSHQLSHDSLGWQIACNSDGPVVHGGGTENLDIFSTFLSGLQDILQTAHENRISATVENEVELAVLLDKLGDFLVLVLSTLRVVDDDVGSVLLSLCSRLRRAGGQNGLSSQILGNLNTISTNRGTGTKNNHVGALHVMVLRNQLVSGTKGNRKSSSLLVRQVVWNLSNLVLFSNIENQVVGKGTIWTKWFQKVTVDPISLFVVLNLRTGLKNLTSIVATESLEDILLEPGWGQLVQNHIHRVQRRSLGFDQNLSRAQKRGFRVSLEFDLSELQRRSVIVVAQLVNSKLVVNDRRSRHDG